MTPSTLSFCTILHLTMNHSDSFLTLNITALWQSKKPLSYYFYYANILSFIIYIEYTCTLNLTKCANQPIAFFIQCWFIKNSYYTSSWVSEKKHLEKVYFYTCNVSMLSYKICSGSHLSTQSSCSSNASSQLKNLKKAEKGNSWETGD